MSSAPLSPETSPNENLPPVKPPTAGFLIQLFVIPLVIVGLLVIFWMALDLLTRESADPKKLLDTIAGSTKQRWNAAVQLASALADPKHADVREDGRFMEQVARVLDDEIARPSDPKDPMMIRVYLCRCLQQFHVADGLPSLIAAAKAQTDADQFEGRIAAIEAIGRLADNVRRPLVKQYLPAAADAATQVAAALQSGPHAAVPSEHNAESITALARRARDLAKNARRTGTFGPDSAKLAAELVAAAQNVESRVTTDAGRTALAELRHAAEAIAQRAPQATKVDGVSGRDPLSVLLANSAAAAPIMQFDAALKKEVDRAPTLREIAAMSLGLVGGPQAFERLRQLVNQERGLLRYNAAAGLCREGFAEPPVLEALVEMLNAPDIRVEEPAEKRSDVERDATLAKARSQVVAFGLSATNQLALANDAADLSAIQQAVDTVAEGKSDPPHDSQIVSEARRVADVLRARKSR